MTPHPFSLRQLQYAVAVAEARGFRTAAERCHVSQPSLSAQIAQLEAAAERAGDPLAGTIRIGVIPTVSAYLLPDVVPALRRGLPRLVVLWDEEKTGALLQAV